MKKQYCRHEGCTNYRVSRGVCVRHGATKYICRYEGCTTQVSVGGVCIRHGAKRKICSHDGCTNKAANGGVCVRHGAKSYNKMCSHEGCTQYSRNGSGGVCVKHGAKIKVKSCSHEGCTNQALKKGLCYRHRDKSKSGTKIVSSNPSIVSTAQAPASIPDLAPIPVTSSCTSSNVNDAYSKDTDDEDEGLHNYKTEQHPIKKEYDEAYDLDTDDESGVKKEPV